MFVIKGLSLRLICILGLFAMVACGGSDEEPKTTAEPTADQSMETQEMEDSDTSSMPASESMPASDTPATSDSTSGSTEDNGVVYEEDIYKDWPYQ